MALLSKLSGRSQKNIFCTRQLYNRRHALQWKSCALGNHMNAGVFRQLFNAYFSSSNVNVLLSGRNVIVARRAALVLCVCYLENRVFLDPRINRSSSARDVLLAPHTSGPRELPRCGALSLLQKTPHYRGDPAETAARLNVNLCVLATDWWWSHLTPFSTRKLKAGTEIKSRRGAGRSWGIRGCWFVLLSRTLPPAAPPTSPVAPVRGMIGRVLYTAVATRPAGPHTDIHCRNRRQQKNRSNRQRRREDTANDPNS